MVLDHLVVYKYQLLNATTKSRSCRSFASASSGPVNSVSKPAIISCSASGILNGKIDDNLKKFMQFFN